jgi:glycosyltransferase involved in cell wall biosynthesis
MKIAFSARGLSLPGGGPREFIKCLIPAIARQEGHDELYVFYNRQEFMELAENCHEVLIKGENRLWWDFVLFPRALTRLKIDAAILPKNVIPGAVHSPAYVVIHDLAYFDRKLSAYPFFDTIYMRVMVPRSVRRATAVFAVSQHTKNDVVRYTKCDPEKIVVTYEAADPIYRPVNNTVTLNKVKQKYRLPDSFVLYTGSLSPRKNLVRLLEAFHMIHQSIPHDLVLTGSTSWKDAPVHQTLRRLRLGSSRVRQLGYVDYEDMPALYNLASAYVYPSLYEGFGLPVLEAMQCGCPVVASSATSIPEVAGQAALLVDPLNVGSIAEALFRVLTNKALRERLILSGFDRAKLFSWDACAKTMLDTIRQSFSHRKSE